MSYQKKVGRPTENSDKRGQLIQAARQLFVTLDYDKVSLRAIAKVAEVDSALIRYYFHSKLGLFTEMLKETAAPVLTELSTMMQQVDFDSPEKLMRTYYHVMSENPDFPKLIFKLASMPSGEQDIDFKNILQETLQPRLVNLFDSMSKQGLLQAGVDPLCAQMSFFSMMVFPFLMPEVFKQAMGIKMTPEFMMKLAEQNVHLMQHGYLAGSWQAQNSIGKQHDK